MRNAGRPDRRQQTLDLRTWGGRRAGAGRKPAGACPGIPHRRRGEVRPGRPAHVTLRMADHVWNLRSQRSFAVIHAAIFAVRRRPDLRVTHFSVQGNHLHLIVEASGPQGLANGIRALSIRLARGLNRLMGRRGPVLEDRYHLHVLGTPGEARNAVRYVLRNFAGHAARRGERVPEAWVDPFSSQGATSPRILQRNLWDEPVTRAPESWLLRGADAAVRTAGPLAGSLLLHDVNTMLSVVTGGATSHPPPLRGRSFFARFTKK